MRPEQIAAGLAAKRKAIPGPETAIEGLEQVAKEVASQVRGMAARNRHQIQVRVVRKQDGVRVTIVGHNAIRYRRIAESELARRKPDAAAIVRAQVTRKTR